jgi:hypothetical protein
MRQKQNRRSSNLGNSGRRDSEEIRQLLEDSERRVREYFEEIQQPKAAKIPNCKEGTSESQTHP